MQQLEILKRVNRNKLKSWLRTVLLPTVVQPEHFEHMGFERSFVRPFFRKHGRVLLFDGTVARKVRGVNEFEFLRSVADVLGVRPFADRWDPRDTVTTVRVAHDCHRLLEMLPEVQEPDVVAETVAPETEARS